MTKPRKHQISLDATPFYHIYCRCVRRAFLSGKDPYSGQCYEHRRQFIENDLIRLGSIFFVDVAAFAILHNHYHLVLHVNVGCCEAATPLEIAKRWHQLFSGTDVTQRFVNGEYIEPHEAQQLDTLIDLWRHRLHNISWFMKVLNENIARRANEEDDCTGHFWESRFKSTALLDDQAILSCMAYVDLNPIRAGIAETPEQSDHTSIQMRINYWQRKRKCATNYTDNTKDVQPESLFPFVGSATQPMPDGIPFNLIDYIQLVDWTGRQIREDKRGSISTDIPPIIQRLEISSEHWVELACYFESRFKGLAGSVQSLKEKCGEFNRIRLPNRGNSKALFG